MSVLDSICTLEGHTDRAWHVSWHPIHDLLATCGSDKTVRIWAPKSVSSSSSSSAAASTNNISESSNSSSSITSAPLILSNTLHHSSWHCIAVLDDFSTRTLRCCEWSPCGRFLGVGSFDGNAYIWRFKGTGLEQTVQRDPKTGQRIISSTSSSMAPTIPYTSDTIQSFLVATLEGHENEVKCISWSASGTLVATCSRDKSIWLWEVIEDGEDFDCMAVLHGHEQDVKFIQWHPTRELLFSASYDNTIKCWGETNDDWICINTLSGHTSTVWGFTINREGNTLLSVSDDKSIRIWNGKSIPSGVSLVIDGMEWNFVHEIPNAHNRTIYSIDFSRTVDINNDDNTLSNENKEEITKIYNIPRVVTGGGDDVLKIWRYETEIEPNHDNNNNGTVKSIASLIPVVTISHAHRDEINCVRWHPHDTTLLATCSDDMTIKLWRYEES